MNYTNKYAFKEIKENPIILNFSNCKYLGEIHLILKEKFGLPECYGENWDALWDLLDGLFYDKGIYKVKIYGFNDMPKDLKEECKAMFKVFLDVSSATPNVTFELVS